jgi:hypothetical protein
MMDSCSRSLLVWVPLTSASLRKLFGWWFGDGLRSGGRGDLARARSSPVEMRSDSVGADEDDSDSNLVASLKRVGLNASRASVMLVRLTRPPGEGGEVGDLPELRSRSEMLSSEAR